MIEFLIGVCVGAGGVFLLGALLVVLIVLRFDEE
jgi:hypothetical protein